MPLRAGKRIDNAMDLSCQLLVKTGFEVLMGGWPIEALIYEDQLPFSNLFRFARRKCSVERIGALIDFSNHINVCMSA